jgi:hypothetical protein
MTSSVTKVEKWPFHNTALQTGLRVASFQHERPDERGSSDATFCYFNAAQSSTGFFGSSEYFTEAEKGGAFGEGGIRLY